MATDEPLQVEVSETEDKSQRRFKSWFKTGWGKFTTSLAIVAAFGTIFSAVYPVLKDDAPTTTNNVTNNFNTTTLNQGLPDQGPIFDNQQSSCPVIFDGTEGSGPEGDGIVKVYTKNAGTDECWTTDLGVPRSPSLVTVMIAWKNNTGEVVDDLIFRFNLPPDWKLQPSSTTIYNGSNPNGASTVQDDVTTNGISVGDYADQAVAYMTFELIVPPITSVSCGDASYTGVGIAHPKGTPEFYNVVNWNVTRSCN